MADPRGTYRMPGTTITGTGPLVVECIEPAEKVYYLWLMELDGKTLPALNTPPEVAMMGYEHIPIWWDAYTATQDLDRRLHTKHPITVHRMTVKDGQCRIDPEPVPAEECQLPGRFQNPFDMGPLRGYVAAVWLENGALHISTEFKVTEMWHGMEILKRVD